MKGCQLLKDRPYYMCCFIKLNRDNILCC